jgi:glucose-6-phosphate 1-dehydrogenase
MKTRILVFGITGDLSVKKLFPAISKLALDPEKGIESVIGVTRRSDIDADWLLDKAFGAEAAKHSHLNLNLHSMDIADESAYQDLKSELSLQDNQQLLVYLSVPPSPAALIADFLGKAGLNGPNVKLVFEKPFGWDLESATELLNKTKQYFNDQQIYRIDHYLAKGIAGDLGNWSLDNPANEVLSSLDVVLAEEGRVQERDSFDQMGILIDIFQNHGLQLVSMAVAELPTKNGLSQLPAHRLQALSDIKVIEPSEIKRAQYEGYQEDVNNPGSQTETYVRAELFCQNPDWQGVPITLTTGKALDKKCVQVRANFKDGTSKVFEENNTADAYYRMLDEALQGRKELFVTGEEIIRSWQILDVVQKAWDMGSDSIEVYSVGSPPELG